MQAAGILLGGGRSSRFGSDKLAAKLDGVRLVDVACAHFLQAGLDPVVFVGRLRPKDERVHLAPPGPRMIDSLRAGITAAACLLDAAGRGGAPSTTAQDCEPTGRSGEMEPTGRFSFVFAPADMPALRPDLIRTLLVAWQQTAAPFLLPVRSGRRGHPACAGDPGIFFRLGERQGAREVWRAVATEICEHEVRTADILFDVDTPEDLAAAASEDSRRARVESRARPHPDPER